MTCSFCHKPEKEGGTFITARKANICQDCILKCLEVVFDDYLKVTEQNRQLKSVIHFLETV